MTRRHGLTLLELLVSIAIVGVLVALLLPAVQGAREVARRAVCASNVRQIVVACRNYELAFGAFPPLRQDSPQVCWSIFILPYVEQFALYDRYDRSKSWSHPANQRVVSAQLPVFQCPSAPDSGRLWDRFRSNLKAATGDFAAPGSVDTLLVTSGLIESRPSLRGLLTSGRGARSSEVLDGLSYTIMFTEDAGRPYHYTGRKRGPANHNTVGGNAPVIAGRVSGAGWADPSSTIPLHGFSRDGLTCPGPCPINCTNNNEAYSFHFGGIDISLGDGATRFLSDAVSIEVYASLITAQGGEFIPEE